MKLHINLARLYQLVAKRGQHNIPDGAHRTRKPWLKPKCEGGGRTALAHINNQDFGYRWDGRKLARCPNCAHIGGPSKRGLVRAHYAAPFELIQ